MTRALAYVRRWLAHEDGNSTIEFVVWMPFIAAYLASAIEVSLISTRMAMLNAGLDRVVRALTLGSLGNPSHDQLRNEICYVAGVIPDCDQTLKVELERISTSAFNIPTGRVDCIDRVDNIDPLTTFTAGVSGDLMLITACAAITPVVPQVGLGLLLPKINNSTETREPTEGEYALVAFSAFVVEP